MAKPILLIDDDPVDQLSIQRSFEQLKLPNELIIKGNGKLGMDYLEEENHEKPCLILLDVRMPVMDGEEFINHARGRQLINNIPVLILTEMDSERMRRKFAMYGVAGYMTKDGDKLNQNLPLMIKAIEIINLSRECFTDDEGQGVNYSYKRIEDLLDLISNTILENKNEANSKLFS